MRFEDLPAYVWRGKSHRSISSIIPTGFVELDRTLPGGGWPQGAITEIYLDRYGIGELGLLIPALRQLTPPAAGGERKWIIFIAPPFIPYAPALVQHGVAVEQLLLVHPSARDTKSCLWAVEQAVRSGSSAAVLAWLRAADGVELRRLQIAAEAQACWTVLFRPKSALDERSPAALRLRFAIEQSVPRVTIVKCRGGRPAVVDLAPVDATPQESSAC